MYTRIHGFYGDLGEVQQDVNTTYYHFIKLIRRPC